MVPAQALRDPPHLVGGRPGLSPPGAPTGRASKRIPCVPTGWCWRGLADSFPRKMRLVSGSCLIADGVDERRPDELRKVPTQVEAKVLGGAVVSEELGERGSRELRRDRDRGRCGDREAPRGRGRPSPKAMSKRRKNGVR